MKENMQVKFKVKDETRYGIVEEYSKEAKEAKKNGQSIVEDAITPRRYVLESKDLIEVPFSPPIWNKEHEEFLCGEYDEYVASEFKKALKISNELDNIGIGSLIMVPVADGWASYVVTKVNKKTCKIEWRGFSMDRWVDMMFGYGGTFDINLIEKIVNRGKALDNLMGS